jgi:hypothetical protein
MRVQHFAHQVKPIGYGKNLPISLGLIKHIKVIIAAMKNKFLGIVNLGKGIPQQWCGEIGKIRIDFLSDIVKFRYRENFSILVGL